MNQVTHSTIEIVRTAKDQRDREATRFLGIYPHRLESAEKRSRGDRPRRNVFWVFTVWHVIPCCLYINYIRTELRNINT
jgi:hypothetical protein